MPMRLILLVLDGLGIGEMPDVLEVRPQDIGANTLETLVENVEHLQLPNLLNLGLGHIVPLKRFDISAASPLASYGRSRLAHQGADSYLGHQEMMGTIPSAPAALLMRQVAEYLELQLKVHGYAVRRPLIESPLLLVNESVVVGDNLEADPGLNINLTVATDLIDFEQALKIGKVIRDCVGVSRVIVFGGPGISIEDILSRVEHRDNGQVGVNSPALGVYNQDLYVQHLGYGVDPDRQAPSLLIGMGLPVILLGKMADLVVCPGAIRDPIVPTGLLMQALLDSYSSIREGFIAATVQEFDLIAHEGDVLGLASVLEEVDRCLGDLLPKMTEADGLLICADHGNDPQINIGLHTREETPLLFYQRGRPAVPLGIRDTLADVGATITHLFHAPPTQDGVSFLGS